MRMVKAVTEKDIALKDVVVSLQQADGNIEAIVITDSEGKYIRVVKDNTYSDALKVLIEEPKEYKTVYKLTVKIDGGVSVYKLKDKQALDNKIQNLFISQEDYIVEEVQVEVKKNLNGQKQDVDFDSVPF